MKGLVLFSGGLDSVIVVKLLQEQGIEVDGVYIQNGFRNNEPIEYLYNISKKLKIKLTILNKESEFFDMWKNPKYGYGKAVNPCVNCHALMVNTITDSVMFKEYDFIATGDVLEQRGNSQSSVQLKKVIKLIDKPELVLRPLSALRLKETQMELSGMVNREKLLGIVGKSRKIQYELLEKYGLSQDEVEKPGGGCLMADANMKIKVDRIDIQSLDIRDFQLMKIGRHLNINDKHLVLSRNAKEETLLNTYIGDNYTKVKCGLKKAPIGFIENKKLDNDDLVLLEKTFKTFSKEIDGEIFALKFGDKK